MTVLPKMNPQQPPRISEITSSQCSGFPKVTTHKIPSDVGSALSTSASNDGRVKMAPNKRMSYRADMDAPTLHQQHDPHPDASPWSRPPPPCLGHDQGPPPMNIVIQIVGSRGDVQPFVALGKALLAYGHRVRIATHETFASFVQDNDLEFFCIGGDPAELMASMVKKPGLRPESNALAAIEASKRRRVIEEMMSGCWMSCIDVGDGLKTTIDGQRPFVADAIIANPPSFAHIHIAERLGIPLHLMFTMPWSPTTTFPHPMANIQQHAVTDAASANYMSYTMADLMTWKGLGNVINRFRTEVLELDPISPTSAPGLLERLRVPYTYCWSPALIPKPGDWGDNIDVSGFFFLDLASPFTPPADLDTFLRAGPPPVYIGFGSIIVHNPGELTKTFFEAVRLAGVRALVSKGWGGIGEDDQAPEGVFILGDVPHDWLFSRVSAVCHHGGAGTCSASIKAGRPTAVVPFFGDQPFWGAMVSQAGAGPEPIPYADLTAEKLAAAIRYCLLPETQARAQELGYKVRGEAGTAEGCKSFHRQLQSRDLACDAAPERCAAWKVKRTVVKLSPFAAAVLVRTGELKYSDLKLYISAEYNTEEQQEPSNSHAAEVSEGFRSPTLEPVSGISGIPAYSLPSINPHLRALFSSGVSDDIVESRIQQGEDDLKSSSDSDQQAVLARWRSLQ